MEAFSVLFPTAPPSPSPLDSKLKFFCKQKETRYIPAARKMHRDTKQEAIVKHVDVHGDFASLIRILSIKKLPHVAHKFALEMKSQGVPLDDSILSALMLCYANNGLFSQAIEIWDEMINSSYVPDIEIIRELIDAYCRVGLLDEITRIVRQLGFKNPELLPEAYALAISCYGKRGELEMMEKTLKEMVSKGYPLDSATGNAFIVYYSSFGSLPAMEAAYENLKRSRILIEKEGIRAMSLAYIREKKFHSLGEFLRDVGLGRKNAGNLLWNFLLLSYAANFKMKSLQREFLRMLEAGFHPDLTTFNIRAVAFSKMSLFWDLHLSLEHMKHNAVTPDLVTYGCVVDAYMDRRLGRNLNFALRKMNVNDFVRVSTDPVSFEVLGKGDFHSSSEPILEYNRQKHWTYKELISIYLKKKYRYNQVFWNY